MATLLLLIIYLAFISLGLPDSLLGVSWPVMQPGFGVAFGSAGYISIIISTGTILSSLFSGSVLKRFGTGNVTAVSVGMTAAALAGFAFAPSFIWLLAAAVPLGLGGGAVDSGLNSFVAEHYQSRHMSWLHSFWGIGAVLGSFLVSRYIASGSPWQYGYLTVSIIQTGLVILLCFSLPLWHLISKRLKPGRNVPSENSDTEAHKPFFYPLSIPGVKLALVTFFFYCGVESTVGLWGSSFLVRIKGLDPALAAVWVSLFYGSITAGRLITGFITMRVSNRILIRTGEIIIVSGCILMLLPLPEAAGSAGFILAGFGCAPIFPCMIHDTPARFGNSRSQAVIGFQMAAAYTGLTLLPPAFGFLGAETTFALFPVFLISYALIMLANSEALNALLKRKHGNG